MDEITNRWGRLIWRIIWRYNVTLSRALGYLLYTLEYMNRWSALITLTLVLCDVAIESPTLAQPRPFPHQWKETVLTGSNLSLSETNCVTESSKALMGIGLHLSFNPGQCKYEEALKGGGHLLRQYRYWSDVHHLRGWDQTPNTPTVLGPRLCEPLFSRKAAARSQAWGKIPLRALNPQKYNWDLRCTFEFSL